MGLPFRPRMVLALVAGLGLTAALAASPLAYEAMRSRYMAQLEKQRAEPPRPDPMLRVQEAAKARLMKQLNEALGPLAFQGMGPPELSPDALEPGAPDPARPIGLVFQDPAERTFIFVAPETRFADWLARQAREDGTFFPEGRKGIAANLANAALYTVTVGGETGFGTVVPLPLPSAPDEKVHAALGVFTADDVPFLLPRTLVIGRLAQGRLVVARQAIEDVVAPIPACTRLALRGKAQVRRFRAQVRAERREDDTFDDLWTIMRTANAAFEACITRELPRQPYYGALTARVRDLLDLMRGK